MKLQITKGRTSKLVDFFIRDSSSTTGAGLTGLVFNTASLTAYYYREGAASATAITLVTMTVGTWASGGFKEIDSTNLPGWYQLGVPDAALVTGADSVAIHLKGAANMAPLPIELQLQNMDAYDGVRGGLTALPNAAAAATGGLACIASFGGTATAGGATSVTLPSPASTVADFYKYLVVSIIGGTGVGQSRLITAYSTGRVATVSPAWATNPDGTSVVVVCNLGGPVVDANLAVVAASVTGAVGSVTGNVGGNVTGSVGSVATGGIVAGSFAAGAIDAAAIATDAIGSAELAASAVTEIQTGLATSASITTLQADTDDIQTRLPAALVSGRIDASVGAMAANTLTATAIATDAIGAAEIAADAVTEIAGAVWDELRASHLVAGSFGQAGQIIRSGTAQAGGATSITLDASASAVNSFYNNTVLTIVGGTGVGQARFITAYVGATKVATVQAWATNPDATSVFLILPFDSIPGAVAPTASQNAAAVWDEARASHVGAGSFGQGVASVQGNVTGSAASVTGSVGSVASGGITAASFAAGAIDAAAFAQAAADKIWASTTRTLSAFSTALAVSVWDVLASAVATASSIGLQLKTNVDAAVTTRLAPTVAARTLDVSATGEAGLDWANIGAPTTTQVLSGTTVGVATALTTNNDKTGYSLLTAESFALTTGTASAGGASTITLVAPALAVASIYVGCMIRITGGTGNGQVRVITAYTAGRVATVSRAWTTVPDGTSVYSVLGIEGAALDATLQVAASGVNGNVTGSVGSVTGNVGGNVVGSVASVTGAVGSVATGGIVAGSFAAGAIDAAAIATDAIGSAELAASAVTEIQTGLATAAALATVQADTDDIQARLPAALVSGRIDASVGAMAANTLTATAIATDAITAAKIAADAIGASELAADAVTEIQAAVAAGAVASVTGNVGGNVVGSVGSVASGGITTASFAAGAINAAAIATDAIGAAELAADAINEIADQVWDEVLSGHLTAGTTGAALNSAGSAGDPWATAIPGAYGAGSAGNIVGNRLDAAVTTRLAPTVAARTLDVAATGEAGLDFDNIKDATGAHTLTNITVPLVTTTTTASNLTTNNDKTGYALSAAGIQAVWDALTSALTTVGSIGKRLADNVDALISSRSTVTPGQVKTQVTDALTVDTYAELGSVPAATSSLKDKLNWLFILARNKFLQTSTTQTIRNDADTADVATAALSDDLTTYQKSEWS